MAYAYRINDLAKTLAQYPTVVTITGNKLEIRTSKQLETLNAEISTLEKLAARGDTELAKGTSSDAANLSSRLESAAPQISLLLKAFAAQDSERLKSLSIIGKQQFNGTAANRLQAETHFAEEVSNLLKQEAQAVAKLETSENKKPEPEPAPTPVPEPSLNEVIADLPGFLQAAYPLEITGYDRDQLSAFCTATGNAAVKLGAITSDGVTDFVIASLLSGEDLQKQDWSDTILKDGSLGTIDDRIAIARNAAESRKEMVAALPAELSSSSQTFLEN